MNNDTTIGTIDNLSCTCNMKVLYPSPCPLHGITTIPKINTKAMYNPRRNRLDLMHPAEKAIHDAVMAIEKMEADVELTNTQVLLQQAKDKLSDYLDATTPPQGYEPSQSK